MPLAWILILFSVSPAMAEVSPKWARLIHADSGVEREGFFLSEERTAESELLAFVKGYRNDSGDGSHRCRFPARFRVAKELGFVKGDRGACPRFERWRDLIRAESVELVFASAFINSPSSMYGHTFLKFKRSGRTKGSDLLDYAVSFGADTGASGGFNYVWKGLTGGFPGFFSTSPFYLKVKEYGEMENRDLWVYPLDFSRKETELLVEHLWELRDVRFPYYFLSRNCSYFLLEFLEAARPDLALTKNFPLWAIPVDTIRTLGRMGLVMGREYRASHLSNLQAKRALLSTEEEELAYEAATDVAAAKKLRRISSERRGLVAAAAYDLFRHRRGVKQENELLFHERELFTAARDVKIPLVAPEKTAPELAHGTERLGVKFGKIRGGKDFWELRYRGALHDPLDSLSGYEVHSALAMGDLALRWENKKILVEEIGILKILSLAPSDSWVKRVAWNVSFGFERIRWIPCVGWGCGAWSLDGGPGYSRRIFGDSVVYGFLNSAFRAGAPFRRHIQWDMGPKAGVFLPLAKNFRMHVEGERRIALWGGSDPKISLLGGLALDASSYQIRLQARRERAHGEAAVTVFRYF